MRHPYMRSLSPGPQATARARHMMPMAQQQMLQMPRHTPPLQFKQKH